MRGAAVVKFVVLAAIVLVLGACSEREKEEAPAAPVAAASAGEQPAPPSAEAPLSAEAPPSPPPELLEAPEAAAALEAPAQAPAPEPAGPPPIPDDAQPTQVDLSRVAHHFASAELEGDDLLPFEAALLSDRSIYRVDTRERVLVHKADDGSIIGFVDHNRSGEPDSIYTLAEVMKLEPGAEPDTVEIVFRIHHSVEENVLVFSDREHRRVKYVVTGSEFRGVPITTWMSSRQYAYYGSFWSVPKTWQFTTVYVLPAPEPEVAEVKAKPRPAARPTPVKQKEPDHGLSIETGVQGGSPHINIKLKK